MAPISEPCDLLGYVAFRLSKRIFAQRARRDVDDVGKRLLMQSS